MRAEMSRAGATQEKLGHSVGLSQSALSRRLSGQASFTVEELEKTAQTLNVDVAILLGSRIVTVAGASA